MCILAVLDFTRKTVGFSYPRQYFLSPEIRGGGKRVTEEYPKDN